MKLPKFMQNISKRAYAIMALAVATIAVPATLLAWGPASRVTFTMAHPATYVTFNSITNNPKHGDERNFVQIRNFTDNGTFGENTALVPGKEYEVYVFFHNNASTTYNDAAHNYSGVATGAFMRTTMPATVAAGANAQITSYVGATNAKHLDATGKNLGNQVWDEAYGKNGTSAEVALRYVPGSAKITSNGAVNGKTLPDSLYTTGTPIGYNTLDGKLPGCTEFSGYVTYRFKVDQPNFEIQKTVSKAEANQFGETVKVNAGDKVDFTLKYKNTGTTQQDGITIRDTLPAGLTYVNGSTYFANSTTGFAWKPVGNDDVTKNGLKFGSYAPGAAVYVKFSANVVADSLVCGTNTFKNIATAITQNGSKSDDATVTVDKECKPVAKYTCDVLKVQKISRTEFRFTTEYTLENATFKSITYVVRDADNKTIDTETVNTDSLDYTQTTVGKYTVQSTVNVTIDGKTQSATSDNCKAAFEVSAPTPEVPEVPETPVTPTEPTTPDELPTTGIAEGVMSILGVGSLAAATSYYRASRKLIG
ncbi:DUF11 domain-containing protein [Candidatus Saccharibacteria bacterium]|nr:DUF11 domain-containing protein [Candidatus Saccharibacteria bacterium]